MQEIRLTQGYVALVDDEDFERVNQFEWFAHVSRHKDGTIRTVYAEHNERMGNRQKTKSMHRFILGITDSKIEVDHEDHNGLNNQRYNLRKGTKTDNQHNAIVRKDNTSGFKGVNLDKDSGKWVARIQAGRKRIFLGHFTTSLEAAWAYDEAAREHHGEFANPNFVEAS